MSGANKVHAGEVSVLAPGTVFHGVYEVVRCIKSGGMGAVYEVIQTTTKRRRALKVMLPSIVEDAGLRERFKLEASVAAGIDSEHIVETLDAGVDAETDVPFIVMELLKGQELGALIRAEAPLPPEDVVTMLGQVAMALDKTHAAGIVHRDLKPENIFVTRRDDGSPRLKVLDFGVAKILADNTGAMDATRSVGSPLYMAPEQFKGERRLTPRADLYSLAHITYTMLTGMAYWVTERRRVDNLYALLLRIMEGLPMPAAQRALERGTELPEAFSAWFAKATALNPDDRYESAISMVAELASALGVSYTPRDSAASHRAAPSDATLSPRGSSGNETGSSQRSIANGVTAATREPAQKPKVAIWIGLGGVAVALCTAAILLSTFHSSPPPPPSPTQAGLNGTDDSIRSANDPSPAPPAVASAAAAATAVTAAPPVVSASAAASTTAALPAASASTGALTQASAAPSSARSAAPKSSTSAAASGKKPGRPSGNPLDEY